MPRNHTLKGARVEATTGKKNNLSISFNKHEESLKKIFTKKIYNSQTFAFKRKIQKYK